MVRAKKTSEKYSGGPNLRAKFAKGAARNITPTKAAVPRKMNLLLKFPKQGQRGP